MTGPAPTGSVPVFDAADPGFSITSAAVHRARENSWYARTTYGLAVLRHAEVAELLHHPRLRQGSVSWLARNGVTEGPLADWWASWVLHREGEDHRRLRRLLNPAFSSRSATALLPRFRALATELTDAFADRDRCEFVAEFAEPYAARVIAMLLGIPEQEWPVIARESAVLGLALGVTVRQDLDRVERALAALHAYADELIADRRRRERDDFLSRLVHADRDGDRLGDEELRDSLVLLVFGGFDTTRNQLGLALQTFARHPAQWRFLADRPELGARAAEEVIRVNPTVRWITREALEDFTFRGLDIPAGTTVQLWTESAGTDPRVHGPYSFDITAEREPHFGFGGGFHHCLGHFVARADIAEALPVLARRLRDLRIAEDAVWLPDSGNTGPVRLPLLFTPAP
ncbi:cytochrome P450 [Streptomyces clavuligerus]|uniref:Cytochrome P450 n=1 Tax=Streptomyces clavuligerus TaxID=1901 RepID=B5GLS4_STRCL|nr:cytochrome P450 [Streptomyces clavuligerus]EDY47270.1 cytochrome P450 [Streptomyces clavuligerus]EFG04933.1 cytochrome P450 [Streptomyces clavuligerus]MBY6306632.1 cytochrome P450 [Streptomyces clavuligerus]QCS10762.1 cytochrome P450 [Streptomyces clavuligerus]QPJ97203.1 cytochrome P450 [Streptomyces clavuligerus]